MNASQIIKAFLQLLEHNQSSQLHDALPDLPNLDKSLPESLDDQIHKVADTILDWCDKHHLIDLLNSARGFDSPPPQNPASQEEVLTNIYEIYQELKQKIEKTMPPEQSESYVSEADASNES